MQVRNQSKCAISAISGNGVAVSGSPIDKFCYAGLLVLLSIFLLSVFEMAQRLQAMTLCHGITRLVIVCRLEAYAAANAASKGNPAADVAYTCRCCLVSSVVQGYTEFAATCSTQKTTVLFTCL